MPKAGRAVAALSLVTTVLGTWIVGPAQASYDPIASGRATLTLDPSFRALLKRAGIQLQGRRGTKVAGRRVSIPVGGGKADPTIRRAEIDLHGQLVLVAGPHRVALTAIALRTQRNPLLAKVGGGQLKVARASRVELGRDGFGNDLDAAGLRLSAKAATRLDKRLHVDAFRGGQRVGRLRATTEPVTLAVLPAGRATFELDPTFLAKLDSLSTSVNSIFPAERHGATVDFSIGDKGRISTDARLGQMRLVGAVEFLRLGSGQVFWRDPWLDIQNAGGALLPAPELGAELDLEPAPPFEGAIGRAPVLIPDLAAAQIAADPEARTVTVAGAPIGLTNSSAFQFNRAFAAGSGAFQPGERIGSLSFTAQTQ
jgi:hypothetical protein